MVAFLVRWGDGLALGLSALPLLLAIAFVASGQSWLFAVAGIILSPLLFVCSKSYVELIKIIDDNLLPK